jgi:hypothetical protein
VTSSSANALTFRSDSTSVERLRSVMVCRTGSGTSRGPGDDSRVTAAFSTLWHFAGEARKARRCLDRRVGGGVRLGRIHDEYSCHEGNGAVNHALSGERAYEHTHRNDAPPESQRLDDLHRFHRSPIGGKER